LCIIYPLPFNQIKVPVEVAVHSEHVQVIRCEIKPGSIERFRDLKDETISEKIRRVYP
jgi:hypothetical protein